VISVANAKERLGKVYARKSAAWAIHPFDSSTPVTLGLKSPTDRQAVAQMSAVADWLVEWSQIEVQGVEIVWESRRWPNSGTQQVPVKLTAGTPAAVAAFVGRGTHWRLRHKRAQKLLELGQRTKADPPELRDAVVKVLAKVDSLSGSDFERIFDVLDWLNNHPASGLYPRQLPVAGIDSKWLERHATIVRPLHLALGGAAGMGLATPPKMYRVKFLDAALAPGGLGDLAAPLTSLAQLQLAPLCVLIVENLQTLLSLPPLRGVVALHGGGYDVQWCAQLPWVRTTDVLYWGDLDADGLSILSALRGVLPGTRSVMMERNTLEQFSDFAVPDPNGQPKSKPGWLEPAEAEAYEQLRKLGGMRLEQERILWAYALAELLRSLPSDTPL